MKCGPVSTMCYLMWCCSESKDLVRREGFISAVATTRWIGTALVARVAKFVLLLNSPRHKKVFIIKGRLSSLVITTLYGQQNFLLLSLLHTVAARKTHYCRAISGSDIIVWCRKDRKVWRYLKFITFEVHCSREVRKWRDQKKRRRETERFLALEFILNQNA